MGNTVALPTRVAPLVDAQAEAAETRTAWVSNVMDLGNEVKSWASARGWAVAQADEELSESVVGGAYTVPRLKIDAPEGRLILEPVARGVVGAEGRVDLYAWPSHYRVMLLRRSGGDWVIRTESGLDWPQPWNRETFLTVAQGLLNAA